MSYKSIKSEFIFLFCSLVGICFVWGDYKIQPSYLKKDKRFLIEQDLSFILKSAIIKQHLPSSLSWTIEFTNEKKVAFGGLYHPASNTIFIGNYDFFTSNQNSRRKLLSHEITHLIHNYYRPHEKLWVQEGIALLSEYLITQKLNAVIDQGIQKPEVSLTKIHSPHQWTEDLKARESLSQYGQLFQYFYYVYRICGEDELFHNLLTSSSQKQGLDFIEETLKEQKNKKNVLRIKTCSSFKESFKAFQLARFFPNVLDPWGYVVIESPKAHPRKKPLQNLPPYSAQVYLNKNKNCKTSSNTNYYVQSYGIYCLEIRFK